jgi:hypothetical protein
LFTGFQPAPIEPWPATAADPCNNVAQLVNFSTKDRSSDPAIGEPYATLHFILFGF